MPAAARAVPPRTVTLPAADAEAAARLLEDFRPGSGADRAAKAAATPVRSIGGKR
jgi:hypothetical protein